MHSLPCWESRPRKNNLPAPPRRCPPSPCPPHPSSPRNPPFLDFQIKTTPHPCDLDPSSPSPSLDFQINPPPCDSDPSSLFPSPETEETIEIAETSAKLLFFLSSCGRKLIIKKADLDFFLKVAQLHKQRQHLSGLPIVSLWYALEPK